MANTVLKTTGLVKSYIFIAVPAAQHVRFGAAFAKTTLKQRIYALQTCFKMKHHYACFFLMLLF
ncbi:hypothetical protein ACFSC6_09420 [Rufibacter sediminis]|uniref:Uncharacterized protein n=1 Tax=Rufibacter sediminis TaxID=2762756 RepID=A0ABR6VY68_9BACT|nr:hypothetical protein [Rufibacter sediminis]MBC3541890.1 hypothetical protein [Rufibacter sediminis]